MSPRPKPLKCRFHSGMTLLELTVVILVLLSLVVIFTIGARAWRNGADRSGCIMNLRNTQMAVRSYQNLNNLPTGASFNMATDITGADGFIEDPVCPAGGSYTSVDRIPDIGTLVTTCSLGSSHQHYPNTITGW